MTSSLIWASTYVLRPSQQIKFSFISLILYFFLSQINKDRTLTIIFFFNLERKNIKSSALLTSWNINPRY